MTYETPESFEPVLDTELTPELCGKFYSLLEKVCDVNIQNDEEARTAAADLLHQHVTREVSAHPILARAICKNERNWTLLKFICERLLNTMNTFQETIKFLIEANPHALLWTDDGESRVLRQEGPVHTIAEEEYNAELLCWIVERYPWVFQHPLCQKSPPHSKMMSSYVNDRCDSEACKGVRKFYELYPQGLREKDSRRQRYPLWVSMKGRLEPDADLVIWMATQYPEAVQHLGLPGGCNMLHVVCDALAEERNRREPDSSRFRCTPNMAKICRFLISEHSTLILQTDAEGNLPIHKLANRCNRRLVQDMVVLLLKAYPLCILVKAGNLSPELAWVPFIQHVYPLIIDELETDEEISDLTQTSQHMTEAAALSTNDNAPTSALNGSALKCSLLGSLSEVFSSWVNLRISDVLSTRKRRIQEQITDACLRMEGNDTPNDMMDDDDWNEEDDVVDDEDESEDDSSVHDEVDDDEEDEGDESDEN